MRRALLSLVASATVALFACSSTNNNSSPAGACVDYVAALREGAKQCGRYNVAPNREGEISARLERQCTLELNAPGTGVTPSLLAACSVKIRAACGNDDACEDIEVRGTLADGAACASDAQCAGGDCKTSLDSERGSRCGVCVSRVAIGGACGGTNPSCVKGATCETKSGGTGTCVERKLLAEGEVCYDPAKPSSTPGTCAEGLGCNIGTGPTSAAVKCTPRGATGAACESESQCLSELACVMGKCENPGPIGIDCTSTSQCANGVCSTTTKKCVAIQWVESGGACDNGERRCARGSCSGGGGSSPDGKCIDPIADGAPCVAEATSSTDPRCDRSASCINGICQIFDPSTCK